MGRTGLMGQMLPIAGRSHNPMFHVYFSSTVGKHGIKAV
jgi:hypothetical protein